MTSILESFNDPHARHAMIVHLPIAGSLLGLALLALLAAFRFKPVGLRVAVTAVYAAITVGAVLAADAGEAAEENVEHSVPALTSVEESALEAHEEAGEGAWVWLLAPAALSLGMFVPKKKLRVIAGGATLLAAAASAGWISWTGHLGGELVYTHGLGVPAREKAAGADVARPEQPAGRDRDGERNGEEDDNR